MYRGEQFQSSSIGKTKDVTSWWFFLYIAATGGRLQGPMWALLTLEYYIRPPSLLIYKYNKSVFVVFGLIHLPSLWMTQK